MRSKHILIVLSVIAALAAVAVVVSAGNPNNPPGPPETTSSYRLEDIYNRLAAGAAGTQITFTEPISGPTVGTGHTLDEIMGIAPSVDDTNGAGVADVVNGKTFWGLTSGGWGLQTGTATGGGATYNAGVPKTGQTISYTVGDDGDLEMGVDWITSTRFITGTTGVVTDTLTGLVWLENANCAGGTVTWTLAISYSNALYDGCTDCFGTLGDCGLSDGSIAGDWRLPNVREMQSLVDYGKYDPALPGGHPFTGVQSHHYWSSTTHAHSTSHAWYVNLLVGLVSGANKTYAYYVWPVRGGQ